MKKLLLLALLTINSFVFADEVPTGTIDQIENGKVVKTWHTYITPTDESTTEIELDPNSNAIIFLAGSIPPEYNDIESGSLVRTYVNKTIFTAFQPGQEIVLKVFNDDVTFITSEIRTEENGDVKWIGTTNDQNSVIIFHSDETVNGSIHTLTYQYDISTLRNGEMWMIRKSISKSNSQ